MGKLLNENISGKIPSYFNIENEGMNIDDIANIILEFPNSSIIGVKFKIDPNIVGIDTEIEQDYKLWVKGFMFVQNQFDSEYAYDDIATLLIFYYHIHASIIHIHKDRETNKLKYRHICFIDPA